MSRGGGRGGGRGGRGGRGGSAGRSMTQDLIRDNMEDLGLDSFQVVDDRIPPPLYPDTHIPIPIALTDEDSFAVQKMREISHRCCAHRINLPATTTTSININALHVIRIPLNFLIRSIVKRQIANVTVLPDTES